MSDAGPLIYLLHGNDELGIAEFLRKQQSSLGDASLASMNITRLDGRTLNLDEFYAAVNSMPFMTKRRLVILENPTACPRLASPDAQKRFLLFLENTPPTSLVFLVEYRSLIEKKNEKKRNWLEKWASAYKDLAQVRIFMQPTGSNIQHWIQERARSYGGSISPHAASELAQRTGNDLRVVDQEIQKLLAYTGYKKIIDQDDVEFLTADIRTGDIFALVDAVGNRNPKTAMKILERLLETDEPISIFGMIVRQYRLLIQARDFLDLGGNQNALAVNLNIHPYVAEKIGYQVKLYAMDDLKKIYQYLLSVDESLKTSQMPGDLLLESLVVRLGSSESVHTDPEMVW